MNWISSFPAIFLDDTILKEGSRCWWRLLHSGICLAPAPWFLLDVFSLAEGWRCLLLNGLEQELFNKTKLIVGVCVEPLVVCIEPLRGSKTCGVPLGQARPVLGGGQA